MAFAVQKKDITSYIHGKILQDKKIFDWFGDNIEYPHGAAAGAIGVPVISDVTSSAIDGTTNLSDGVTNSLVDLTIVDRATCLHVTPKHRRAIDLDDMSFMKGFMDLSLDAFCVQADDEVNDATYTAAPNNSETITAGYANFTVDTTSADTIHASAFLFNQHIGNMIGGIATNNGGSMEGIIMKAAKTAWKNLLGIATLSFPSALMISGLSWSKEANMLSWNGIPITLSAATEETNWGVVSKECLYGYQKRSFALVFDEIDIPAKGVIEDGTGRGKIIPVGVWGYASIDDDLQGMCVNSTS